MHNSFFLILFLVRILKEVLYLIKYNDDNLDRFQTHVMQTHEKGKKGKRNKHINR